MLFPQHSRLELRHTLERVGNDFDVAITAIIGEHDMANCVDDPQNRKVQQSGKCVLSWHKSNVIMITVVFTIL